MGIVEVFLGRLCLDLDCCLFYLIRMVSGALAYQVQFRRDNLCKCVLPISFAPRLRPSLPPSLARRWKGQFGGQLKDRDREKAFYGTVYSLAAAVTASERASERAVQRWPAPLSGREGREEPSPPLARRQP